MAFTPIAFTIPNYRDYKNYWLKAYEPSTTTPKAMSLDSEGSTLVSKVQLNKDGFPVSAGEALIIPYISGFYDLFAFRTEAEADNNDTSNALRFADNISSGEGQTPSGASSLSVLTQQLSAGQTVVSTQVEASTGRFYVSEGPSTGLSKLLTKTVDYNVTNATEIILTSSYPQGSYLNEVGSALFKPLASIDRSKGSVEVIAHRGFKDNSFENTILALSLSIEQGADALEMDVSISSDGVFYLFHDTTVDSLTDGTGTFTALTSTYIDGLKYTKADGTPYEGLKITKFDDALDYIRETGIKSYIEMKALRNSTSDVDSFVQKLKDFSVLDQTVIQSFKVADLQRLKLVEPTSFAAFVVNSTDTETIISDALSASASMVINSFDSFISVPDMSSDFANAGLDSASYTPDYAYTFKDLTDVGVRKIMSDRSAF